MSCLALLLTYQLLSFAVGWDSRGWTGTANEEATLSFDKAIRALCSLREQGTREGSRKRGEQQHEEVKMLNGVHAAKSSFYGFYAQSSHKESFLMLVTSVFAQAHLICTRVFFESFLTLSRPQQPRSTVERVAPVHAGKEPCHRPNGPRYHACPSV